jgi:hypothetical protein
MSKPSTGAPKKIRKSWSRSGVPWNSWMNAAGNVAQPRDVAGAAERDDQAADRAADERDQRERQRPARRREDEEEVVRAEGAHVVGFASGGRDS